MSRGFDFDSFEMDDFRESHSYDRDREIGAGRGGSSLSGASVRLQLQKLREKETASDRRDSQIQRSSAVSPDHRNLPLRSDRERTQYSDRDRTCSLRPSEIHTLIDVGRFRVVAVEDLANLGYAGDRPGTDNDLRNLVRQGLLQRHGTSARLSPRETAFFSRKARDLGESVASVLRKGGMLYIKMRGKDGSQKRKEKKQ
jgi:hypothetical protein